MMSWTTITLAAAFAASATALSVPMHAALPLDEGAWNEGPSGLPGGRFAVISGDPANVGPFVIRVELPPGYTLPPYRRSRDENIVVLSGAVRIGTGSTFDAATMHALPAGSFIRLPANETHFVMTKLGATIQIFGTGPFEISPLERCLRIVLAPTG
jgi:hypothetical protein